MSINQKDPGVQGMIVSFVRMRVRNSELKTGVINNTLRQKISMAAIFKR